MVKAIILDEVFFLRGDFTIKPSADSNRYNGILLAMNNKAGTGVFVCHFPNQANPSEKKLIIKADGGLVEYQGIADVVKIYLSVPTNTLTYRILKHYSTCYPG